QAAHNAQVSPRIVLTMAVVRPFRDLAIAASSKPVFPRWTADPLTIRLPDLTGWLQRRSFYSHPSEHVRKGEIDLYSIMIWRRSCCSAWTQPRPIAIVALRFIVSARY